jgi:hypothetical protein
MAHGAFGSRLAGTAAWANEDRHRRMVPGRAAPSRAMRVSSRAVRARSLPLRESSLATWDLFPTGQADT